MLRHILHICIFLFLSPLLWAQTPEVYFKHLGTAQGLSDKYINCALSDHRGLLWFGTDNGLNLYDGVRFTVFKNRPGDSSTIPNSRIMSLADDGQYIWVSSFSGISRYDIETHQFTRYLLPGDKGTPEIPFDTRILFASGRLWVASGNGLYVYIPGKDCFERVLKQFCRLVTEGDEGHIWLTGRSDLQLFDTRQMRVVKTVNTDKNIFITCTYPIKNKLCIGTWNNKLLVLDENGNLLTADPSLQNENTGNILQINRWNDSLLLLCCSQGLRLFNIHTNRCLRQADGKLVSFAPAQGKGAITTGFISGSLTDVQGTRWVYTDIGLFQEDKRPLRFKHYNCQAGVPTTVIASPGGYYLSSWYGQGVYHFQLPDKTIPVPYARKENPNQRQVHDILLCGDTLYIASFDGLFVYHHNKTEYFAATGKTMSNRLVHLANAGNYVVLGTYDKGIMLFDKLQKTITPCTQLTDITSLHGSRCFSLIPAANSEMYFGTTGLYVLSSNNHLRHLKSKGTPDFNDAQFNDLYVAGDGTLWAATSHGVFAWKNGDVKRWLTVNEGLPDQEAISITEDGVGNIWFTTKSGLCLFEKQREIVSTFLEDDGLLTDKTDGEIIRLQPDLLLLTGSGYFTYFKPSQLIPDSKKPEVILTALQVDGKNKPLPLGKALQLHHGDNMFAFEFAALNFLSPHKNQYAYRLAGYDKTWNYCGNRNYAAYTNLDPGTYTLQVKAANHYGVWNETGITVPIIIYPPWWQTWWFRITSVLCIGLSVFFAFRYRVARIKKEEARKTEFNTQLAEQKVKALRSQMNPHFIFNSLNSIQECIVMNNNDAATEYLSKFAILVRNILDNSQKNFIPLLSEVDNLRLYLDIEKLRFDESFRYEVLLPQEPELEQLLVPPMVFQPYIENAIWHGLMNKEGERLLQIEFSISGEFLLCTITDNGIGRARAMEYKQKYKANKTSTGIRNTEDRLLLIPGAHVEIEDLHNKNGNPTGTRVLVQLPLHYKA